jgi:hypothetical protein
MDMRTTAAAGLTAAGLAAAGQAAVTQGGLPAGLDACQAWAVRSQVIAALARRTALQAQALDVAAARMAAAAQFGWNSPAGRLCAEHIRRVAHGTRDSADGLRGASMLVAAYGEELRVAEAAGHAARALT